MRGVQPAVMTAMLDWDAGERRIDEASPYRDQRLRVMAAVEDELRRRVGNTYTLGDLQQAYDASSRWFLPLAERTAPGTPEAWDPSVALDAAFARWARNAKDSVAR
jgi:hypothetical protein